MTLTADLPETRTPELRTKELQEDFAKLLEVSFETPLKIGSIVVGEILKVERDGLLVDIGGKSEGFVPMREIYGCRNQDDLNRQFEPRQVREFYILGESDGESVCYTLSLRRVVTVKNWEQLKVLQESNETVQATVTGSTKGGILVNILDLKGFIPASQIRVAKTLNDLVGETLPAKILEVDKSKNKLILSNRAAVFEQMSSQRAETLARLHEGDRVEGTIVKVTNFGVFIDINGIDGLLPLSEISWHRINHPSEVLELGQRLEVQVLTVDRELQRISLSRKRLEADPWDQVNEWFQVNEEIVGPITKVLTSGILVEMTPGVEAYCAFRANSKIFALNQSCRFRIVSINGGDRRMTLEYLEHAETPMKPPVEPPNEAKLTAVAPL